MESQNSQPDLEFDLGFQSLLNTSHIDFKTGPELNKQLKSIAESNFQSLVSQMLNLKQVEDQEREKKKLELQIHDFDKTPNHITLPEPLTIFPRFRQLPKNKPLTRFEKYMKTQGLQKKKKRSKLVYDEMSQDWVYRYGSKGIKHIQEKFDVVREV